MKKLLQLTMVFIAFMPVYIQAQPTKVSNDNALLDRVQVLIDSVGMAERTIPQVKADIIAAYKELSDQGKKQADQIIKDQGLSDDFEAILAPFRSKEIKQRAETTVQQRTSNKATITEFNKAIEKLWKLESTSATKESDLHQAARETLNAFNGLSADDRMTALLLLEVNSYDLAPWSKKLQIPMVRTAFAQEVKEQKEKSEFIGEITVLAPAKVSVDCSYEAIKAARTVLGHISKHKGNIDTANLAKELANQKTENWEACGVQPEPEDMINTIVKYEVLKEGEYALFQIPGDWHSQITNGEVKNVQKLLKDNADFVPEYAAVHQGIKKIQTNRNASFAFVADIEHDGVGGHWAAYVVNKVDGKITYYVVDNIYWDRKQNAEAKKQVFSPLSDRNKEVLTVLKSLIEGKLSLVK